jgi:hypothetical protein
MPLLSYSTISKPFSIIFIRFILAGALLLCIASHALAQQLSDSNYVTSIKDSDARLNKFKRNKHSPEKATILSLIAPGAGQIYNRKYWKAPIVWGGLGACGYFFVDNHIQFITFRDAFRNRMNGISQPQFDFYSTEAIKAERELYQRNRDFMALIAIGVYLFNVIDATVDGHLLHFDVSDDLSLQFTPTILSPHGMYPTLGLNLQLTLR